MERVGFHVQGERLVPVVAAGGGGAAPIPLGAVQGRREVEAELVDAFNEHLFHVQRRSAELQALGLSPQVDPVSLGLSTQVAEHGLALTLVADRQGNFQVSRAMRDGKSCRYRNGAHLRAVGVPRARRAGGLPGGAVR